MTLSAIILAAGKATRMKSDRVKVMHEICGQPMLTYVIDACRAAGVSNIFLVVGHDKHSVIHAYARETLSGGLHFVEQAEQKGTGHAVMVCRSAVEQHAGLEGDCFVLGGDGPLIRGATLLAVLAKHRETQAAVTLATSLLPDPTGYGRIVRDAAGSVVGIVEQSDATEAQKAIKEVNPTYWLFKTSELFSALEGVQPNNRKGEYYLTDTLAILKKKGKRLEAVASVPPEDVLSINTRAELSLVQEVMQRRIQKAVMESGVTLTSPGNTWIEFGATIGQDAVLEPFSWIGAGAQIGSGVLVKAGTVVPRGTLFNG